MNGELRMVRILNWIISGWEEKCDFSPVSVYTKEVLSTEMESKWSMLIKQCHFKARSIFFAKKFPSLQIFLKHLTDANEVLESVIELDRSEGLMKLNAD